MNYLIHAAALLAGCYIYYYLALRRETFFQLNRWLLLGGMVVCFLLPLITVPERLSLRAAEGPPTVGSFQIMETPGPREVVAFDISAAGIISRPENAPGPTEIVGGTVALPVPLADISPALGAQNHSTVAAAARRSTWYVAPDWKAVAQWVYLTGVLILVVRFIGQLVSVLRKGRGRPTVRDNDVTIVALDEDHAPFSFWNSVFLNPAGYDTKTYDRIIEHERVHIRQRHTVDLIVAELLIVVQWFNPFAWLYRRAVENNLEYLTDAEVLRRGDDPVGYQLSLLQVAVPHHARGLVTNYNQHFLEKRIKMMKAKRSANRAAWKYLALPGMLLCSMSSFNAVAQQSPASDSLEKVDPKADRPFGNLPPAPPPVPPAPPNAPAPPSPPHGPAPAPPAVPAPPPPAPPAPLSDRGTVERSWTARIKGDEVCFHLIETSGARNYHSDSQRCFDKSNLGALPRDGMGVFSLTREAGTITFRGIFEGDRGTGTFDFEPAAAFEEKLEQAGYGSYTNRELVHFFYSDITSGYLDYLEREDFNPDHDQLVQLAVFEINQKTLPQVLADLKASGYARPDLETIVQLRIFDIDALYVQALADAGYRDLDLQDVINAKIHDLTPEYISEIARLGFGDVDFEEIIAMAIHDVDADYVADLAEAGYTDVSAEEVIASRIHNVRPEYIRAMSKAGLTALTLEQAQSASIHGVDPGYVAELAELGFEKLSIDDVIAAKIHGVNAERAKEMQDLGLEINDIDDLSSYSIHDLTPDFVRGLRDMGYTDLSADDLIAARIHDISPAFVRGYADLGYGQIPFDVLQALRIHNVTPAFIEKHRREGDTLEDMIDYSIMRRSRR
ncbi:beta-lactamase regulating signal transducer with metallopeptidase domain [Neolewinella xylanilytica]|uniref:Beta-lactamase regulating signal transducer with metallopeptidase domain n=1 Tax=Neolewinella xylanilytica TaxID=1514080 RepID=A0A2S6I6Y8_9BACT|nr:M56 family metallopeptidase [Neolewinella xylanilytica]PPK87286.1 beta-lactamase regulating signal transducer with metallopeptidase domain [Neolewinella xylanilytica]